MDRGCGFDPKNAPAGDGIENMRYRTEQLNGTFLRESGIGEGTLLVFKMPKP
jgi:signal transduction histidine kinase